MYSGIIYETARAFPEEQVPDVGVYYENIISECRDIFGGNPPWKKVKKSGLYGKGERNMSLMNAGKMLCDTLSDLTFGRQSDIIVGDAEKQKYVDKVLRNNSFRDKMPQNFSLGYALGGALVKVFISGGDVRLDYVSAENFVPLKWNSRRITEGVFRSKFFSKGMCYTLFEKHGEDSSGSSEVTYKLFASRSSGDMGTEVPLTSVFPNMKSKVVYPFTQKMFSYFHPAVSNNIITDGCLGMSAFYNYIDTLKSLDIVFDSFSREFILGRKRIIVPSSCIRTIVDPETGGVKRYFDADDEVYQALRCDEEKDLKIIDNTSELRVDEHVSAVNTLLNILCFQTGLASGTLSFGTSSGIRTAAEISSQENRTNRTMNSHCSIAAEYIENIVRGILAAGEYLGDISGGETDIKVTFSKETDINVDKEIDRSIKLAESGIIDMEKARKKIGEIM